MLVNCENLGGHGFNGYIKFAGHKVGTHEGYLSKRHAGTVDIGTGTRLKGRTGSAPALHQRFTIQCSKSSFPSEKEKNLLCYHFL